MWNAQAMAGLPLLLPLLVSVRLSFHFIGEQGVQLCNSVQLPYSCMNACEPCPCAATECLWDSTEFGFHCILQIATQAALCALLMQVAEMQCVIDKLQDEKLQLASRIGSLEALVTLRSRCTK